MWWIILRINSSVQASGLCCKISGLPLDVRLIPQLLFRIDFHSSVFMRLPIICHLSLCSLSFLYVLVLHTLPLCLLACAHIALNAPDSSALTFSSPVSCQIVSYLQILNQSLVQCQSINSFFFGFMLLTLKCTKQCLCKHLQLMLMTMDSLLFLVRIKSPNSRTA